MEDVSRDYYYNFIQDPLRSYIENKENNVRPSILHPIFIQFRQMYILYYL